MFQYVLGTGRTWKGKIGSAKIVMDLSGLKEYSKPEFSPKPTFRKRDSVEWHFVNFEPRGDMTITANWFYGFLDIFVNDTRVMSKASWGEEPRDAWIRGNPERAEPDGNSVPYSWGNPPTKKGNDVFASVRAVAYWLGGDCEFDKRAAAVTIRLDKKWVRLRPRDNQMWTHRGCVNLSRKPFLEDGYTRVPMAAIVRGLGGKSKWKSEKLYLTL
jgi:hypothetical protein